VTTRRLAAIIAADVAGYSRLMHSDEERTHAAYLAIMTDAVAPAITQHGGRLVKSTGDGFLAELPSAVEAVRCALRFQGEIARHAAGDPPEQRLTFRVGINLGDVIVEPHDIFGDGVNLAARLESLAEPGGILISAAVHEQVRGRIPCRFDDLGEQQVKNMAAPVRVYRALTAAEPAAALALPDKPSIAALPFQNLSPDPEQGYFADGLVEEIITALSRVRSIFVIARNSSFAYKGKSPDIRQVGRELGVQYVLEGSVRRAANRVRVTGQLIDAPTGAHIWADRFEGQLDDIFELQDKITTSVVGAIEPKLRSAEIERARRKPTGDLRAYDLWLRALAHFNTLSREGIEEAIRVLERAIEIDPDFALAYAQLARCLSFLVLQGWVLQPESCFRESTRLAHVALERSKDDPEVLAIAAQVLGSSGADLDAAISLVGKAISLNPNSAFAFWISGMLHARSGDPEAALEHLERAARLSPMDTAAGLRHAIVALAHFVAGRYELALQWTGKALNEAPNFIPPVRTRAACLAHLGRLEEARRAVAQLRTLRPDETIARLRVLTDIQFRHREHAEALLEGLRLAGLPE